MPVYVPKTGIFSPIFLRHVFWKINYISYNSLFLDQTQFLNSLTPQNSIRFKVYDLGITFWISKAYKLESRIYRPT